jgi:hypothetical protein
VAVGESLPEVLNEPNQNGRSLLNHLDAVHFRIPSDNLRPKESQSGSSDKREKLGLKSYS